MQTFFIIYLNIFYFYKMCQLYLSLLEHIMLCMDLSKAKLNKSYIVTGVEIVDTKINLRIRELGVYIGAVVEVKKFSPLKKTMLIRIFNSLFAIKTNIAKKIFVSEQV